MMFFAAAGRKRKGRRSWLRGEDLARILKDARSRKAVTFAKPTED